MHVSPYVDVHFLVLHNGKRIQPESWKILLEQNEHTPLRLELEEVDPSDNDNSSSSSEEVGNDDPDDDDDNDDSYLVRIIRPQLYAIDGDWKSKLRFL